ncbi:conserved membrane protein of unknown function [Rhizobium leguminosarum]|uniref:Uncharacterized protein n=2 Tax=Rhizobium leguminosarum TaxID=384 RepID=A0A2K9Z6M4_RHILE|nr:conserved membrane protein of unknown function [Rhizobium leguminosarum]
MHCKVLVALSSFSVFRDPLPVPPARGSYSPKFGMLMLFFLLFVLPYIVGFVGLAFWRQGWTLMAATVAMIVVYFFSIGSGDGPGAFAADALPAVLAAGIAAGLVTSVIAMTSNYRPGYIVAAMFPLGYIAGYTVIRYF